MSAPRTLVIAARASARTILVPAGTRAVAARGIASSSATRMSTITVQVDGETGKTAAVPSGTLGEVLSRVSPPEVQEAGASWVAHMVASSESPSSVSSAPTKVAVWSPEHGIRLLPTASDVAVNAGAELTVRWSDFMGIEPQWLHARLTNNPALTRDQLLAKYMKVVMM